MKGETMKTITVLGQNVAAFKGTMCKCFYIVQFVLVLTLNHNQI